MPQTKIFGFSGNITRPSTTRTFVDHIVGQLAIKTQAVANFAPQQPTFLTPRLSADTRELRGIAI
ncbi:hypothetical protein [Rhizobium etli]|uniref:hypothetical protein n=1 Tax=Rhizobium etli TaxID=29449 RepID=UPI000A327F1E|nr:hypothetical protein [Rhizobium etli]